MNKKKSQNRTTLSPIRSLNQTYRKKQSDKIEIDNIKILNRIKNQKPSISFNETEKSFWQYRKLSANISNIHKYRLIDY
jgi:hypothetical protein